MRDFVAIQNVDRSPLIGATVKLYAYSSVSPYYTGAALYTLSEAGNGVYYADITSTLKGTIVVTTATGTTYVPTNFIGYLFKGDDSLTGLASSVATTKVALEGMSQSGDYVYLSELTSGSGAGGGLFIGKASGTVDNVTTFSASGGGVWVRTEYLESKILRPEWAGAKADGVTDNVTALQSVLTIASASGGTVKLGPGQYNISGPVTISGSNVSLVGDGAGSTRIVSTNDTLSVIILSGVDVHSIEIASLHIEGVQGASGGGIIDLREGIFDVKIHDIVTFHGYHVITTAYGTQTSSTKIIDVIIDNFEFRDIKNCGIYATMITGLKVSNGVMSFKDPQNVQPEAASRCIYLGDWVDGFWMDNLNLLGGETTIDCGQDWVSGGRVPAMGQIANSAMDSGWIASLRIRDGVELFFDNCQFMALPSTGSGYGVYIDGPSTDINGVYFNGGQCVNNQQSGLEIHSGAQNVKINGMTFRSNSRRTDGTWHGIFVDTGQTYFYIDNCLFDNYTSWFGANGQGYGVYISAGCDNFRVSNNVFKSNVTGGLNDLSTGVSKVIVDNLT